MVVPLFSGVLLVFSRVFLYWLMGMRVCRSIASICISPLFIGETMLCIGLATVVGGSGVPKGGFGRGAHRNFEVLPKLSRIPSSVEYTSVTT
jgi:hypothetical protein